MTARSRKIKEHLKKANELLGSEEVKKFVDTNTVNAQTAIEATGKRMNSKAGHHNVKNVARKPRGMKMYDDAMTGFDPEAPENRQIVANCKKHKTQKHNLSDKCKKVLSMVEAGGRDRAGKKKQQTRGSGRGMPYTDLEMVWGSGREKCPHKEKYGDKLTESEKYYADIFTKGRMEKKGQDPYANMYEARPANCYGFRQKNTMYGHAPIFDTTQMREQQIKQLLTEYFRDPKAFEAKYAGQIQFSAESIAVKVIAANALEEEEEEGSAEIGGFDMGGAQAPQPMAASESEDEGAWALGVDDIKKIRRVLKKSIK